MPGILYQIVYQVVAEWFEAIVQTSIGNASTNFPTTLDAFQTDPPAGDIRDRRHRPPYKKLVYIIMKYFSDFSISYWRGSLSKARVSGLKPV
jgi:hypothetical protein